MGTKNKSETEKVKEERKRLMGGNLRRLRIERGLSPADLAEKVNTNPKYVLAQERGALSVGPDMLARYCRAFGVGPEEFKKEIGQDGKDPILADIIRKVREMEEWPKSKRLRAAADLEDVLEKHYVHREEEEV